MESLTFYEAHKPGTMKNGDIFKFDNAFFGTIIKMGKNYYDATDSSKRIFINDECSDERGVIIPAKKEMVSAEELAEKVWKEDSKNAYLHSIDYGTVVAIRSAKNRDILYADLMENIGFNLDNLRDEGYTIIIVLFNKINAVLNSTSSTD